MRTLGFLFLLLFFASCVEKNLKTENLHDAWGTSYNHEFLIKDGQKIETYWHKPEGDGPFPVLFLVHGHQKGARMGARHYLRMGTLNRLVGWNMAVVAISLPGYGLTQGAPDFCGPRSQDAVIAAIEEFSKRDFIDPQQMALMGYSRGAIVSSMVATRYHKLSAVVLGVGQYDLESFYNKIDIPGIKKNMENEMKTTSEGFRERSALFHADKIKTPLLVLQGLQDKRGGHEATRIFVKKVKSQGVDVQLREYHDKGHRLDIREMYKEVRAFLVKQFKPQRSPYSFEKKLVLPISAQELWTALTTEKDLSLWWNQGVRLEPKVGGQFYEPWGKGQLATGRVLSFEPNRFIEFTWREKTWGETQKTVCRFTIENHDKGSVLIVRHSGWETFAEPQKSMEAFKNGWDFFLGKLQFYKKQSSDK